MDSKTLYIASQTYENKLEWQFNSCESEWIYIGGNKEKLNDIICTFFKNQEILNLIISRKNSQTLSIEKTIEQSEKLLNKINYKIWDIEFKKIIEFEKVGVYRKGFRVI